MENRKEIITPRIAEDLINLGYNGEYEKVYITTYDKEEIDDAILIDSEEIMSYFSPGIIILPAPSHDKIRDWLKENYDIKWEWGTEENITHSPFPTKPTKEIRWKINYFNFPDFEIYFFGKIPSRWREKYNGDEELIREILSILTAHGKRI